MFKIITDIDIDVDIALKKIFDTYIHIFNINHKDKNNNSILDHAISNYRGYNNLLFYYIEKIIELGAIVTKSTLSKAEKNVCHKNIFIFSILNVLIEQKNEII